MYWTVLAATPMFISWFGESRQAMVPPLLMYPNVMCCLVSCLCTDNSAAEPESVPDEVSGADEPGAGLPSGRRNPPGGKSSLILGWMEVNRPFLPPLISELISSFLFPKQVILPIYLYHRNPDVRQTQFSSTSSSALIWYLFLGRRFVLFLLFIYFDRSTLCICMCMVQSLPLSLQCIRSARKGTKITFIISTNDPTTLTLLQQHKLCVIIHAVFRTQARCVPFWPILHAHLVCNVWMWEKT